MHERRGCTEFIGERTGRARVTEQGSGYLHVLVDVCRGCGQPKKEKPAGNGVGKSIDAGPALNPPSIVSRRSPSHSLLSSPTMSSSAIYAVSPPSLSLPSFSDISHFLYTAQEPPANRPARPRALPTTFTCSPLRVSRYHQIRVRCPFTGHSSPPHSAG